MLDLKTLSSEAQARRRKKPKPANPIKPNDDVEAYYRKHLASLVRAMARSVDQHVMPALKRTKAEYTADSWSDDIESAINAASVAFSAATAEAVYQRLARDVVERTTAQTTASLVRSVSKSVGVNLGPIFEQQPMRDYMNVAINENVSLIKSMPEQYFKSVRSVVYEGVAGKAAPTTIASRLQEETGVTKRRARVIAGDQTKKITSQVTQRRQDQAGIEYYQSIDAGDERVSGRPGGRYAGAKISCWDIARQDIGYGKGVYKVSEGAEWAGQKNLHPGRHHVNCFVAGTNVQASKVKASTVRWFDGDLVTVRTASGKQFSCTPNHPILTNHGWIAAGSLNESHYAVSSFLGNGPLVVSGDSYDVESPIEEVAGSLFVSRGVLPVEVVTTAPDFHGDGIDGHVAVIYTDSLLSDRRAPSSNERVVDESFVRAHMGQSLLSDFGSKAPLFGGYFTPLGGSVGGLDLTGALAGRHSGPLQSLSLTPPANRDVGVNQDSANNISADPEALGCRVLGIAGLVEGDDCGLIRSCAGREDDAPSPADVFANRLILDAKLASQVLECAPGGVFLDQVVSVQIEIGAACHVYNLETESGAYLAEGIISHNCRCTAAPVFEWELPDSKSGD